MSHSGMQDNIQAQGSPSPTPAQNESSDPHQKQPENGADSPQGFIYSEIESKVDSQGPDESAPSTSEGGVSPTWVSQTNDPLATGRYPGVYDASDDPVSKPYYYKTDSLEIAKKLAKRSKKPHVLLTLGDAGDLEAELELDVVYTLAYIFKCIASGFTSDLLNEVKKAHESLKEEGKYESDTVYIKLKSNPTSGELKDAFEIIGEVAAPCYHIIYCGHGMPGGNLEHCDKEVSAGFFYNAMYSMLSERGHYPQVNLYFNC
ncbi:hypothetical protein EDD86DRAFT_257808 [Gorgonomyces haynaldii]|nr:hypothetical protein EDD86DRAFT_257808 [Gorgonomyces haynaldii]